MSQVTKNIFILFSKVSNRGRGVLDNCNCLSLIISTGEYLRFFNFQAIKHLEEEIRILNDDIEEMTARKRSDTVIGRLQGKVERIQEVRSSLILDYIRLNN